jgi:hypothetical protein
MSNLLEQAIIDATALKEVAIKNAEAALVEKYSKEFKESVEKLLEQEAAAPATLDPMATAGGLGVGMPIASKEEPVKNVPSAFLQGEDDDELITIDFDQIKKEVEKALGVSSEETPETLEQPESIEQTPAEVSAEEQPEQPAQLEEELELDEEELLEMYDGGLKQDVAPDAQNPGGGIANSEQEELEEELKAFLEEEFEAELASAEQQQGTAAKKVHDIKAKMALAAQKPEQPMTEEESVEEELELSEETLEELEEELRVDLKPESQLRGYMGTTTVEKKLADNVEKAAARDSKAEEEREEEQKAMLDLKKRLSEAQKKNERLATTVEEFKEILFQLKEHTEKLSVSNAKLLYTNKVLENVSLNERQKTHIVETISRSSSVLEAKTIYETLQSAVGGISEKKKAKESLSEALTRNQTPFLVRQKQGSQEDPLSLRMKILAGIK